MNKKFLTTTLLSISLLSLNLSAGSAMKCGNGFCIVDISDLGPNKKETKVKEEIVVKKPIVTESYKTVLLDNIETIVFTKYVMSENEVAEYDFEEMQKNLLVPVLNSEDLPTSNYLCEDDLKPIKVAGIDNAYQCG